MVDDKQCKIEIGLGLRVKTMDHWTRSGLDLDKNSLFEHIFELVNPWIGLEEYGLICKLLLSFLLFSF